MSRVWALVSAVFLLNIFSLAQSSADHLEVFGGFSFVTSDFTGTFVDRSTYILKGWNASANFKTSRLLGIAADVSGYYPSYTYRGTGGLTVTARSHSLLFGPQISLPLERITPFGHALLGITHVGYPQPSGCTSCPATSDTAFAFALGGGVDFYLTRHLGIRGQGDFFHNGFSSHDNQLAYKYHETNARISAGVVFRF